MSRGRSPLGFDGCEGPKRESAGEALQAFRWWRSVFQIQPPGSKWWRYKYRFAGKEKLLALGTYPDVSLSDARERHGQARKALAAGNDPGEIKQEAKRRALLIAENSFEAVAREWHTKSRYWQGKNARKKDRSAGDAQSGSMVFAACAAAGR